jgi:uncharacterized repeat protein (TIGR03803 family)
MKTKSLFPCLAVALRRRVLPALIAALNLLPAGRVTAQTFTTLHSFTALTIRDNGNFTFSSSNGDGANPYAGLTTNSLGTTLYGTAYGGGSSNSGTVFALNTDGTDFTNLHSFAGYPEGGNPRAGLLISGNTIYGTAQAGGSSGYGTVFAADTDGTGFTNLLSFSWSDAANPESGLILSGNTLYGTANEGGSGSGTVFGVNTDGTGFTNLHSFSGTDGGYPQAGLILSGNTLYGASGYGGSLAHGTVFAVHTNGTGFTNLYSFTPSQFDFYSQAYTNSGGYSPSAGLILSGNTLYGTAQYGGSSGHGTVFAVNTDGSGFTNLHSFAGYPSDGASPTAGLILSGNTLYGTTRYGGSSSNGTVFTLNTDGTGSTILHSFTATSARDVFPIGSNSDGANPYGGLILLGNSLYGTTEYGGSSGNGTVFSISFRPQLTITPSGPYLKLSWPTNVAGFDYTGYRLQSAHAIGGSFASIPASVSPYTIPITSAQQFFRLSK